MEENINPEIPETNLSEGNAYRPLKIENELASNLLEMAKWAKYLSYAGFAYCTFYLINSILSVLSLRNGDNNVVGVLILIGMAIYFIPLNFLYKASTKTIEGINNSDNEQLILGSQNFKSHFKFIGVYSVITVTFYIIMILFALGLGSFGGLFK